MRAVHLLRVLPGLLLGCGASPPEPAEPPAGEGRTPTELPRLGRTAAPPEEAPMNVQAANDDPADLKFLKDITETRYFRLGDPSRVQLLPDGSKVLFLRAKPRQNQLRLYVLEVATGQVRELLTPEQALGGAPEKLPAEEKARRERMRLGSESGFTSYQLSPDGKLVLAGLGGRAYAITVATGAAREVAGPDAAGRASFDEKLSPDGKWVSFVRGGELWVAPVAGGKARKLTSGASETVIHAQAEFVAQEEMGRYTGYWWSPDGQKLVYEAYDTTKVEKIRFGDPASPATAAAPTPYPRPGKNNVEVSLGVIPVGGGRTTWVRWDTEKLPYLAQVRWEKNAPLTLIVQSRDQKELALLAADPRTGKTTELLREHDESWVNLETSPLSPDRSEDEGEGRDEYGWLPDGSGFLWLSERGGDWVVELHDRRGALVRALTTPAQGARALRHLGKDDAIVLTGKTPLEQHLVRVPLAGGEPRPLATQPGMNDGRFAAASDTWVLLSWGIDAPFRAEVRAGDGKRLHALPSVAEAPPFSPAVQVLKVGAEPGLWASVVKPRRWAPGRSYPVIVDVYGGPQHLQVSQPSWRYLYPQWIADHGFIVVRIDGRGTPLRGRAWERAIEKRFAEVPLADQIAGLKALAEHVPGMDLHRVGIYGHSFGGYVAALAVLRRPDVFHAAVAAAPVADWLDYDTHYTERYLGVPGVGLATPTYEDNGLLKYAAGLGGALLIVHGTADDNVHFSHSLELADALFREGKRFELVPLGGQTHAFNDPTLLMRHYQRLFSFFREHL